MNTQQQISRIQLILGHPAMKTCFDCNFVYLPMSKEAHYFCPKCQAKEMEEMRLGTLELETQIEEISTENDDLVLFDKPFKDQEERTEKAKIGAKKSQIAKKIKKKV